jgi:hypothetical protein
MLLGVLAYNQAQGFQGESKLPAAIHTLCSHSDIRVTTVGLRDSNKTLPPSLSNTRVTIRQVKATQ